MKKTILITFFLTLNFANAKQPANSIINSTCRIAFSNLKSKTNDFCQCYSYNMNYLILRGQLTPLISWLNNEMSESEQIKNEALIEMEYEVTSSCIKNKNWIADKVKERLQQ